jgi:TIR domain
MVSKFEIFISHIHEESELAVLVKDWIESTFTGRIAVFVGCIGEDIPPGAKWLQKIDEAVTSSKLLIVLSSPISILRPWINFEFGCAWNKGIPVLPICHSGLTLESLPQPLSTFQALNLEDEGFARTLIETIGHLFKITKIPRIAFSEMQSEIIDITKKLSIKYERNLSGIYLREKSEVDSALVDLAMESTQTLKATGGKSRIVSYLKKISENVKYGKIKAYHRLITGDHITHELHEHLNVLIDKKGTDFRWTPTEKYGNISISENHVIFVLPSPYPEDYTGIKFATRRSVFFYAEFFNHIFNSSKNIAIPTKQETSILCEKCCPEVAHDSEKIVKALNALREKRHSIVNN